MKNGNRKWNLYPHVTASIGWHKPIDSHWKFQRNNQMIWNCKLSVGIEANGNNWWFPCFSPLICFMDLPCSIKLLCLKLNNVFLIFEWRDACCVLDTKCNYGCQNKRGKLKSVGARRLQEEGKKHREGMSWVLRTEHWIHFSLVYLERARVFVYFKR